MTGWNLPPGVSVNDIPGNRPEDMREEAFWETLDNKFLEKYGEEFAQHFINVIQDHDLDEVLYEYVNIARALEGQDAFDQGKIEMEMEIYEAEEEAIRQSLLSEKEVSIFHNAIRKVREQWKD